MAIISQARVIWQTGLGGTGYSVFNMAAAATQTEADANGQAIVNWAQQIDVVMPSVVSWTVDTELRQLDDGTGALNSVWNMSLTGNAGVGTGGPEYAAGVGAQVRWNTAAVVNGRRLIGRTFIVPLDESAYDAGTIATAILANIQSPSTTLAGTGLLRVWHRPVNGAGGSSAPVTTATAVDRVAWLRTRKR